MSITSEVWHQYRRHSFRVELAAHGVINQMLMGDSNFQEIACTNRIMNENPKSLQTIMSSG